MNTIGPRLSMAIGFAAVACFALSALAGSPQIPEESAEPSRAVQALSFIVGLGLTIGCVVLGHSVWVMMRRRGVRPVDPDEKVRDLGKPG